MAKRLATAATAVLVLVGLVVAVVKVWPVLFPPAPLGPVPSLAIRAPSAVRAEVQPRSQEQGLIQLDALVMGRSAPGRKPGSHRHLWPAFHATARFNGASVIVRLDDGEARSRITIDSGAEATIVEVSRVGAADVVITGLASGDHEIRFEKLSQHINPVEFGGFFVEAPAAALVPPKPDVRLIEFVGDSDTLGYGNTSPRRVCSDDDLYAATDTSKSFGPQVAAHFSADYRIVARSGMGLTRNADGGGAEYTLPHIYPRAIAEDASGAPPAERTPDILVIGIGANDFGSAFSKGERWQDNASLRPDFQRDLETFTKARMTQFPSALIVLLAFGEFGDDLVGPYRATFAALKMGHDMELLVLPKLDRKGCHWHPSPRDHAMIAGLLIKTIDTARPAWRDPPGATAATAAH